MRGLLIWAGLALAGAAPAAPLAIEQAIERGGWALVARGAAERMPERLCVADTTALLRPQHRTVACTHLVIDDTPRAATIHYSCPTGGHGRTTLRVESRARVVVETQGIAGGLPFSATYDATPSSCPVAR